MMSGGWSMMLFGTLVTVALWGLLIWVGLRAYRSWNHGRTRPAAETLARRLAAGEIDEDEYRRCLETLRSTNHNEPWASHA